MSLASPLTPPKSIFASPALRGASTPAVAALLIFALTLFAPAVLGDSDTWWHLKAGEWILRHASVPSVDPFSFSFAGKAWTAHEWLSEVLFALAYHGARWSGVFFITAAAAAATVYIVADRLAKDMAGLGLIAVTALGATLLFEDLLARPHVLALPVMAAWCAGLLAARDSERAPSFALLPLMTLWANLHGGFIFGLALIIPFALEALIAAEFARRPQVLKAWTPFALAAFAAALLTPQGVDGLLFPIRLLGLKSLAEISEWRPASFANVEPLEIAILALLFLALWRPFRLPLVRLLLLVGLVHLSLQHARHQMLLGVLAPMLLARPIAGALEERADPQRQGSGAHSAILAFVALALTLIGLRLALPAKRADDASAPMSAVAAVPESLRAQPVLNQYGFGGYLIWAGVRPFIDGRTDMYGDAFMERYGKIIAPDAAALEEELARDQIAWTIFAPSQRINALLDAKRGWRRLYADAFAVVYVREDAAAAPDEHQRLRLTSPE